MKLKLNRSRLTGALRFFAAVPAAALLISCPKLIPDEIALAIQDQFAPRISITSPENGSDFDAKLEIKGTLKDDALVPGDGRGILSYLAVSAGRNPEHNGAIRITPNGKTIIDSTLKESASVEYSAADGTFKITIKNTVDLRGLTNVDITARDLSGNSITRNLVLRANSRPYVEITSPKERNTRVSSTGRIALKGRIGNSPDTRNSITEIKSMSFFVGTSKMGYTFVMKPTKGSSGVKQITKAGERKYNKQEGEIKGYSKTVSFLTNGRTERAVFRLYDDGEFFCDFDVPANQKGDLLRLKVEAVSTFGGKASVDMSLTVTDTGGPEVYILFPSPREKVYFGPVGPCFSSNPLVPCPTRTVANTIFTKWQGNIVKQTGLTIDVFVGETNDKVTKVAFRYKKLVGSEDVQSEIYTKKSDENNPKNLTGKHELKERNISTETVQILGKDSNIYIFQKKAVTIEVIAEDKKGNTTVREFTVEPDETAPVLMGTPKYNLKDKTFDVEFMIADRESEIDPNTIFVSGTRDNAKHQKALRAQTGPIFRLENIDYFPWESFLGKKVEGDFYIGIHDVFGNVRDAKVGHDAIALKKRADPEAK